MSERREPDDPFARFRHLTRLRILIPCATLLAVGAGFAAECAGRRPWTPLSIAPPPTAALEPLVLPALEGTISGRVVGAGGEGIADALVFARSGDVPSWTYSAADGSFRIERLAPGPRSLAIVALGHAPSALMVSGSDAGEVALEPRPEPPSFPAIERATLVGRVRPAAQLALEGCEVLLVPTSPPEAFGGALPRRARVDADGRFEVPDLAGGEYAVHVLPAWARGGSWPDLARALDGPAPPPYAHLSEVEGVRGAELEIELAEGQVRGRLVDDTAAAIEGALVLVAPEADPARVWPPATTAADGSFALVDLPAGRYRLVVRAGAAVAERAFDVAAGEVQRVDLGPLATRERR